MFDRDLLPKGFKITEEDLANTPPAVQELVFALIQEADRLKKRLEELEAKLGQDSSNSNKPPSTDPPYKEKESKKPRSKRRSRKGYRQKLMSPTEKRDVMPSVCSCGCTSFSDLKPYYTHQHIELPQIVMTVIHFVLYRGRCTACGKINKGYVPREFSTGFGPRFSALVGELGGIDGNSRETIKIFCESVLGVHISLGAIQKIIDRVSCAIQPHYEEIRDKARSQNINHLDETTWKQGGKLNWLWVRPVQR